MQILILDLLILVVCFYLLAIIVDDHFVPSLEYISGKLKMSSDVAGATLMAMGSSAPELFVAILALLKAGDVIGVGVGTIVGSAIFNILVIIGASAVVRKATLTWQPVIRDLLFYSLSIVVLLYVFYDGVITLSDSILFIFLYIVYLFSLNIWKRLFPYTINSPNFEYSESNKNGLVAYLNNKTSKVISKFFVSKTKPKWPVFNFTISIIALAVISHIMVESAVSLAHILKVSPVLISLVILAPGTSIPDLLSSINVAKKGRGDMAISNAVGSNIFDIAIGLGLTWFLAIIIKRQHIVVGTENLFASVLLLFATVISLLFILISKKWRLGKYSGFVLIGAYCLYIFVSIIAT